MNATNAKDCKKGVKKSSENGPKMPPRFFFPKLNEDLLREFPMTRKALQQNVLFA